MADYTPNLNLKKPAAEDFYNIEDDNDNMDKIDALAGAGRTTETVKGNADTLAAHLVDYVLQPANGGLTGGTATAYTCISAPAPTVLTDKIGVVITAHVDSGTNPTLNWSGKGAKSIKKPNGNAAILKAGGIYTLRYNATSGNFILQGEGASGNATASDLLSGKTASTDAGDITGTMPTNAGNHACTSSSVSGTTLKLVAKEGYTDGIDDTVSISDPDFVPASIRKDKEVFGLMGTAVQGPLSTGATYEDNTTLLTQVALKHNIRATLDGKFFYIIEGTTLRKYDLDFNLIWSITAVWDGGAATAQPGCLAVDSNGNVFAHVNGTMSVTKYNAVDGSIIQYGSADYVNVGGGVSTLYCDLAGNKFVCDAFVGSSRFLGYNYSTGASLFSVSANNGEIFGVDKYGYFWSRHYSTALMRCHDINDGSVDYTITPPLEDFRVLQMSPLGDAFVGDDYGSTPSAYTYHISAAMTATQYLTWNSAWFVSQAIYSGLCYDGCPFILANIGNGYKISIADKYTTVPSMIICLNTGLSSGTNYIFVGNNGHIYQFNYTTIKKISPNFRWNG